MIEEQWLTETAFRPLLDYICDHLGGTRTRAGRRRLTLFGCACMRWVLPAAPVAPFREAIEFAEAHADRPQTDAVLYARGKEFQTAMRAPDVYAAVPKGMFILIDTRTWFLLRTKNLGENIRIIAESTGNTPAEYLRDAPSREPTLLREIFGNPFRPVSFSPAWRTTDVMLLAKGIYEQHDFGAMPILADALQDAGCTSDDILNHLRDPHATHVRGCWALDLMLGKE